MYNQTLCLSFDISTYRYVIYLCLFTIPLSLSLCLSVCRPSYLPTHRSNLSTSLSSQLLFVSYLIILSIPFLPLVLS